MPILSNACRTPGPCNEHSRIISPWDYVYPFPGFAHNGLDPCAFHASGRQPGLWMYLSNRQQSLSSPGSRTISFITTRGPHLSQAFHLEQPGNKVRIGQETSITGPPRVTLSSIYALTVSPLPGVFSRSNVFHFCEGWPLSCLY